MEEFRVETPDHLLRWNVEYTRPGPRQPTSADDVAKIALSISLSDKAGAEQRVHYQHGVGVSRSEHLPGGLFRYGLSRNIRDAYRFSVENYEEGDELFFFGFSRGAFTAGSTVGLMRNAGILRRENAMRINEAYTLYRNRAVHPNDVESQLFRRSYFSEPRIRFIGVWDTVGALGVPDGRAPPVDNKSAANGRFTIPSSVPRSTPPTRRSLSTNSAARSMLRFGNRKPFEKVNYRTGVVQRVHSDVGGGCADSGRSDITLTWMAHRARSNGLEFRPGTIAQAAGSIILSSISTARAQPRPTGKFHDSRKSFYKMLPRFIRAIGRQDKDHEYAGSMAVVAIRFRGMQLRTSQPRSVLGGC